MTAKHVKDMDFDEFVAWAQAHVLEGLLADGIKGMKSAVYAVVMWAAGNEVFGGKRKKSAK